MNTDEAVKFPPQTWPENAYPTGKQYASWLAMMTPEQQADALDRWIWQAERGAFCTTLHPDSMTGTSRVEWGVRLRNRSNVVRLSNGSEEEAREWAAEIPGAVAYSRRVTTYPPRETEWCPLGADERTGDE